MDDFTMYYDQDGVYKTRLMKAIEWKEMDVVRHICSQEKPDINFQNNEGETALSYSLLPSNYNIEMIECLLSHGADPNINPYNDLNILRALDNHCTRALWMLIEHGARLNEPFQPNPLGISIMEGRLNIAFRLLNYGADPNVPNQYGINPMGNAAASIYAEMVGALIVHGADPLRPQGENENIIGLAAQNGSYKVLKTVLGIMEADHPEHLCPMLNHLDANGRTPLIYAIQSGCYRKVKLLIKYGANANQRDAIGFVPLRYALRTQNTKIVRSLLHARATLFPRILHAIKRCCRREISDECIKHFQKRHEQFTLKTLQKTREALMDCNLPFDLALDIAQRSMPEIYISEHIRVVDRKRANAFYQKACQKNPPQ